MAAKAKICRRKKFLNFLKRVETMLRTFSFAVDVEKRVVVAVVIDAFKVVVVVIPSAVVDVM